MAEQLETEMLVAEMQQLQTSDDKFRTSLEKLQKLVLEHASHEERRVIEPLRKTLGADRLNTLGDRYARARSTAPTHPHPHAPHTPPGNLLVGPVASLFDRMRDAVKRSGKGGS